VQTWSELLPMVGAAAADAVAVSRARYAASTQDVPR